jgi:hypothetical protein
MTALVHVPFAGAELVAFPASSPGSALVAMKPVVEAMGLDWASQHRRLTANPVLAGSIVIMTIESPAGPRPMTCLRLSVLAFWLGTLAVKRISDLSIRDRVVRFQAECADVLYRHFADSTAPSAGGLLDDGARRAIGGIVGSVIDRRVGLHLAPLEVKLDALAAALAGHVTDQTAAPAETFISALAHLQRGGWPQRGRRGVVVSVSARLTRFCAAHGWSMRFTSERGTRLFHVDGIRAWEQAEGRAFLAAARDRLAGQQRLALEATPRRGRAAADRGTGND